MNIAIFNLSNIFKVIGSAEPYYLVNYLSQKHDVTVYLPNIQNGEHSPSFRADIEHLYQIPYLPTFICYNIAIIRSLIKRIRNIDVVYTYKGVIVPALFAKLFNKIWVCDFRSPPIAQSLEFQSFSGDISIIRQCIYLIGKHVYKLILPRANKVVTINEEVAKILKEHYSVDSEKIYILPVGVDIQKFQEVNKKNHNNGLKGAYVGSLAEYRGIETMFKALNYLDDEAKINLVIAGTGNPNYLSKLEDYVENLKIEKRVQWKGFVPHDKIPELLADCEIGISPLPGLESYKLSIPIKVLEYLAAGKAVVASDIRAHRKLITPGKNGVLFPPEDAEELAAALKKVIGDDEFRKSITNNAPNSVQEYSWEKLFEGFTGELEDLIEN